MQEKKIAYIIWIYLTNVHINNKSLKFGECYAPIVENSFNIHVST